MTSTVAEQDFPDLGGRNPHGYPAIGTSLEQATEQLTFLAKEYLQEHHKPRRERGRLTFLEEHLRETARDAGWCIAHQQGQAGLHQLEEGVVRGIKGLADKHHVSRLLDHAFDGIAGWMS